MADAPEANASSPKRPSGDGGPSHFWRGCVATGSPRPASSTDRSMAQVSALMSSRFSRPSSRQATSSLWTTSAATRAALFAPRSARPKPSSSSCQPTRQTSIQSSRPTPEQSNRPGEPSVRCSIASPRQNAQTTSQTQDTLQPNQIALLVAEKEAQALEKITSRTELNTSDNG